MNVSRKSSSLFPRFGKWLDECWFPWAPGSWLAVLPDGDPSALTDRVTVKPGIREGVRSSGSQICALTDGTVKTLVGAGAPGAQPRALGIEYAVVSRRHADECSLGGVGRARRDQGVE